MRYMRTCHYLRILWRELACLFCIHASADLSYVVCSTRRCGSGENVTLLYAHVSLLLTARIDQLLLPFPSIVKRIRRLTCGTRSESRQRFPSLKAPTSASILLVYTTIVRSILMSRAVDHADTEQRRTGRTQMSFVRCAFSRNTRRTHSCRFLPVGPYGSSCLSTVHSLNRPMKVLVRV